MLIALDFDGTLCDSMPALEELAVEVLSDYLTPWAAQTLYRATTGAPFAEQVDEILGPAVSTHLVERFEWRKPLTYLEARPLRGVPEILSLLQSSGHEAVVVSSTPASLIEPWLEFHGLTLPVLGLEQGSKLTQLQRSGATLFVGDSERDARVAEVAGVAFQRVAMNGNLYTTLSPWLSSDFAAT